MRASAAEFDLIGSMCISFYMLFFFILAAVFCRNIQYCIWRNVSGYVCNHGSLSGERDTASPRGCYGERPQRDSCLKIHM